MEKYLVAVMLAAVGTMAFAQPAAEPSEEAKALARAFAPERVLVFDVGSIAQISGTLERHLLNDIDLPRGLPCDGNHPECRAIARELAANEAPHIQATRRAAFERVYALYFDRRMSPGELRSVGTFLSTPAGAKFRGALTDLTGARTDSESIEELVSLVGRELEAAYRNDAVRDEFYARTAHLPRMTPRIPAPRPTTPATAPRPRSNGN